MVLKTPAGCEWFATRASLPQNAMSLLEHYAYHYGETYDSYLATEDDRQYFWSPARRGVIAFVRWGRVLNVVGGLLAPPEHERQLLEAFLEFVRTNRLTVNFFNIGRTRRLLLRKYGFAINKTTEELIIRLDGVDWQGKSYVWLRRQENACLRLNLTVEEVEPSLDDAFYRSQVVPQLEEINREHLAGTLHGRELVFFEGRFNPVSLGRRRIFVTRDGSRIVAFIVCNPALGGDLWAIEIYRRRADAPRGVIPFAMLQVLRRLQGEGVPYASLSSVPFIRSGPEVTHDDVRYAAGCRFFWRRMNWLFDVRGIYHFKSRFRPAYREMYLATFPRMTYASMISPLVSWRLLRVSPLRLARHLIGYWRGRDQRKGLAEPSPRPEPRIRDLHRRQRAAPLEHEAAELATV